MLTVAGITLLSSASNELAGSSRGMLVKGSTCFFQGDGGAGIKIVNQRAVGSNQVRPSALPQNQ
jgi:hypothetical protein